ncbi:hypothetical protein [Alkalibacillus haloalkaliphilus]|uniref:hypothetical protein n=1 Tax=Alkalibacillus haloalkaliphilus TaxID=94136 RepID=UPI002936C7B0|nr:hypothetical protein [Alkalibacillus haloalkaliphilus]MDV2582405.1 hypothetical protein [Alkalibacillus haloalkaliphilus]
MKTKWYLLGLTIIPWISIPFMDKHSIKRFLPVSILMGILLIGESLVARKKVWWWIYKKPHPKIMGETPLILGPYIVGSMWMLRFGFGNILRYSILNLFVHFIFVYVLMDWFKSIGYWSLVRLKKYQLLLLFIIEAIILYVTQLIFELIKKSNLNHSHQNVDKSKL